jgi:glycerol-1-phosphate dehydrogenase [NAD(P)+]
MNAQRQISIPTLVRIKPQALDRLGVYVTRYDLRRVVIAYSQGLPPALLSRVEQSLKSAGVEILISVEVQEASFEKAQNGLAQVPNQAQAIIGLGGGKALDMAKYVSFLTRLPFIAVPTSLSNDGFCSPQSSLTLAGKRRSLGSRMPFGVVIDTEVTHAAPEALWWSGVGDLVSKITAVHDWKLAFHAHGTPVDDFAALLSDATVFQFLARPIRDLEGERLLGNALMLNGVAMEICGSSRPVSGSEHLISHALDASSPHPRLHGLQVGVATYLCSRLQGQGTDLIASLFERTRFWEAFTAQPLSRREWLAAVKQAPSIKQDYYTVLSARDCAGEAEQLLAKDPLLQAIFRE